MPELPEVETTRLGIMPHVKGKTITAVHVREPRLRWLVPDDLGQRLTGQIIKAVNRRAKYLLLQTPAGNLMIHLGMSGSLRLTNPNDPPGKHDHVDLVFGKAILRYHDPRRFGSMHWLESGNGHPLLDHLGPEPLTDNFGGDYLHNACRGRKQAIKTLLMDSRVVVGVGNIYANEALFLAGISPLAKAGTLSRQRCERLVKEIKLVLAKAIKAGGTTLKDFVREDGNPGYFKISLSVYGRGGEPCPKCGRRLREVRQAQRSTVYCTRCQR